MNLAQLLRLEKVDRIEAVRSIEGGGRMYSVRGRWLAPRSSLVMDLKAGAQVEAANRAVDEVGGSRAVAGFREVVGVASSTGVDHHGTEMSRNALDGMALQFKQGRGIAYAPTHWNREWFEIIGRTVDASVVPVAEVRNAFDPSEPQYLLRVRTRINLAKQRGQDLIDALDADDVVGQSIGGWFTKITIVEDDEHRISRIIVEEVELDHLAATRTPSNTDSDDLGLRDRLVTQLDAYRAAAVAAVADDPSVDTTVEERHIIAVEADDETVTVTFARGDGDDENREHDDEDRSVADTDTDPAQPASAVAPEVRATTPSAPAENPDAIPAPAHTRSEAIANEDEEIDMNEELLAQLRTMIGEVVDGKFVEMEGRLKADLAPPTPAPTPAPVARTEPAPAPAPTVDPIAELRAELLAEKAKNEALTARQGHDEDLLSRLLAKPLRQTRAFESNLLHAAMAAEDGDFGELIARTKEEGKARTLVAVSERSKPLMRCRAFDDDPDEHGWKEPSDLHIDAKRALVDLCRAANRDGLLDHLNPLKAAGSGWSA